MVKNQNKINKLDLEINGANAIQDLSKKHNRHTIRDKVSDKNSIIKSEKGCNSKTSSRKVKPILLLFKFLFLMVGVETRCQRGG